MIVGLVVLMFLFALGSLWLPVNMTSTLVATVVGLSIVIALDRAYGRKG